MLCLRNDDDLRCFSFSLMATGSLDFFFRLFDPFLTFSSLTTSVAAAMGLIAGSEFFRLCCSFSAAEVKMDMRATDFEVAARNSLLLINPSRLMSRSLKMSLTNSFDCSGLYCSILSNVVRIDSNSSLEMRPDWFWNTTT